MNRSARGEISRITKRNHQYTVLKKSFFAFCSAVAAALEKGNMQHSNNTRQINVNKCLHFDLELHALYAAPHTHKVRTLLNPFNTHGTAVKEAKKHEKLEQWQRVRRANRRLNDLLHSSV